MKSNYEECRANKLTAYENLAAKAVKLLDGTKWEIGFPHWALTNNNAKIRATKERIEHLQKLAAIKTTEEVINGVRLVINSEDNRVQLFFDGKPSEDIRTSLKKAGFHWAPSVGAWMRQISNWAICQAKRNPQNRQLA